MIGPIAYAVGTYLTLQSGMSTFESTCHTIDGLIDRFIDINTISPVFMNGRYLSVTLRSKSERVVFYTFEDIVFRLCRESPGAEPSVRTPARDSRAIVRGRRDDFCVSPCSPMCAG